MMGIAIGLHLLIHLMYYGEDRGYHPHLGKCLPRTWLFIHMSYFELPLITRYC